MTTLSKATPSHLHLHLHLQDAEEEGQWKNLPTDILALILRRFYTKPDLCRFRSICKSWRSFATPIQPHLLFPLILPPLQPGSRSLSLSPQFLYIFSPNSTLHHHHHNHLKINSNHYAFWITKVEEKNDDNNNNNKWVLVNPFINLKLYDIFPMISSRNVLNLLVFQNHEVGRSYRHRLVFDRPEDDDDDYMEFELFPSSTNLKKVVLLIKEKISVLGFNGNDEIILWNYGDQNWKIIDTDNEESKDVFNDIICYDGKFYAVDPTGRLVMINPADEEVAEVISSTKDFNDNNHYTYLVESDFRLYMVTKMVNSRSSNVFDDDDFEENWEHWVEIDSDDDVFRVPKPLGFRVYVLNEREKSWERVNSLGNKVFFICDDTVFSANAVDLGLSEGNCIYFEVNMGLGNASVYSLEDEAIVTCDLTADHRARIFCLPTSWFVQNEDYPEGIGVTW